MNTQRAAEIQVVLEGIRLPATRSELVEYAGEWDSTAAAELSGIPERSYDRIDEVGEALLQVQPAPDKPKPSRPRDESGLPPGGDAYVEANPQSGSLQFSAPPDNPPEKAIESASKTLKRQAAVQGSKP